MSKSQVYRRYTDQSCQVIEDMIQNLEAGRSCSDNRQCRSQNCNPQTEICESGKESSSCNADYQCGLNLSC